MHTDAPARTAPGTSGRVHRAGFAALIVALLAVAAIRFVTARSADPGSIAAPVPKTPEQLVANLEQRVASRPEDPRAWQQLGSAYGQRLIQTNDPSFVALARRAFDRAATLAPGDAATLAGQGALALTLHQFAAASELGDAALDAAPGNVDALAVVVDAEIELGRYDDAAGHLQQMLDRRPGLAALARVSYLRELHGDIDGAMEALQQAEVAAISASAFDRATVVALRGDLLYNHGRIDDARVAYERALELSPDHLLAAVGHARIAAAHGDLDGATSQLRALADRLPAPTVMALLGDMETLVGRTIDAARAYAVVRASATLQAASGADVDLEMALFEADHGGDAATLLGSATRAATARPGIHGADVLAWARYRTGDLAGAAAAIDDARRLGTRDASLSFHAAAIHAAAGEYDRARAELRDAFAINPWFAIGNRAEVAALAARLDVPAPPEWGPR